MSCLVALIFICSALGLSLLGLPVLGLISSPHFSSTQ
nr:MAG TPA: hypothetical protein [Caudoviricetes sp.]